MPAKKKTTTATGEGRKNSPGAAARARAVQRLMESYPEAWGQFLREERENAGLLAEGGRVTRLQKFVERMRAAGVDEEEIKTALVEAGFKKA